MRLLVSLRSLHLSSPVPSLIDHLLYVDILETSAIAWPNSAMWRRAPLTASMPVPNFPSDDGAESHGHSPSRRNTARAGFTPCPFSSTPGGSALTQNHPKARHINPKMPRGSSNSHGLSSVPDTFPDVDTYYDWVSSIGTQDMTRNAFNMGPLAGRNSSKVSSSDTSMPDYIPSHQNERVPLSLHEHMHMPLLYPNQNLSVDDDGQIVGMKVPMNTPTASQEETRSMTG